MTIKTALKLTWVLAVSAVGVVACKPNAGREELGVKISEVVGFPEQIRISVFNYSNRPMCIPAKEIESDFTNISVIQQGNQIFSSSNADRALRLYKNINALDPIYIALSGKTDFWYDLANFPLTNGPFTVRANIRIVDCESLFRDSQPEWSTVSGEALLNFDPEAR